MSVDSIISRKTTQRQIMDLVALMDIYTVLKNCRKL